MNSTLCGQTKGQYATAVYAYLDEANRLVRYFAAGHPPPLLCRKATQELLPLREGGLLLGVRSNEVYPEDEFLLQPGDRLLILLAILVACGLRRHGAVELNISHLQQREDHWAIVDLIGKASHIRTIPMPDWVKDLVTIGCNRPKSRTGGSSDA